MSTIKVAAAQIECRPGDVAANLALHLPVIHEARAQGVDLLLFPALSLTDYLSDPDVHALARTVAAPEYARIAEAAGDMLVAVGFLEAAHGPRFRPAQAPHGGRRVLHTHRKVNRL